MNNKTTIGIIVAAILIIGGLYFFGNSSNTNQTDTNGTTAQTKTDNSANANTNAQGRVVFSVTDAATDMSTISEINLTLSRVDVHSTTKGWINASSTPKTYSLLALHKSGESHLFADMNTKVGTYDQIRLSVDSVSIKKGNVIKIAKLPAKQMTVNTMFAVSEGNITSVNFDFLATDSMYALGTSDYVFAPVVATKTESGAQLSISADGIVVLSSGHIDDSSTYGMDIDGSVKLNFKIDPTQKLILSTTGQVQVDTVIK